MQEASNIHVLNNCLSLIKQLEQKSRCEGRFLTRQVECIIDFALSMFQSCSSSLARLWYSIMDGKTLVEALSQPKEEYAISFEENLNNIVAVIGNDVLFQCKVLGQDPECTWLRNGEPITCNPRIGIRAFRCWHRLCIRNITIQDIGIYTVLAKNGKAYATSQASLIVLIKSTHNRIYTSGALFSQSSKQTIIKHLRNVSIKSGNSFCLKAVLKEQFKKDLQVQWFFNYRPLDTYKNDFLTSETADSCELIKYHANVSNSGIYTVVIKCSDTILTSSSEVLVTEPQVFKSLRFHACPNYITYFPEEIDIYEHEEVLIMCKINSDDDSELTWYKNDIVLLESVNVFREDFEGRVVGIRILDAEISDKGVYRLELRNKTNMHVVSDHCALTVHKRPIEEFEINVRVERHLKTVLATLGATVVLHCDFSTPQDHYSFYVVWRVGLYKIERSSSNFEVVRSGSHFLCIINNVDPDMAGEVTCTINWQTPTHKSSLPMAVTKGKLVVLPSEAMVDAIEDISCLLSPKLFASINEECSTLSWKKGFKHLATRSSKKLEDFIDKDPEYIEDRYGDKVSSTSKPSPFKMAAAVPEDLVVEFIYCRIDAVNINYVTIEYCDDDTEMTVKKKPRNYDPGDIQIHFQWSKRFSLNNVCFAVDMAPFGGTYRQVGVTTRSEVTVVNPIKDALLKIRVRIVARCRNVQECSLVIRLPTPKEPNYSENTVSLPVSEFKRKYFKTGEAIGVGAYGAVYTVKNQDGEFYAAKVVKTRTDKQRDSTRRELEIMRLLKHRRIVPLVWSFCSRDECILVMEHLWGGELFERLVEEDHFEERTAVHYIRQLCEGLEYLHKKQIVHLDIKPENIVCVNRNSRDIKIVDFGVSRMLGKGVVRTLYGTRNYIAPEVLNFEALSTYSDMWSVGVITYVVLSGLFPFDCSTWQQRSASITKGEYSYDDPAFDNISTDAKDFIKSLLVLKPERRLSAVEARTHRWVVEGPAVDIGIGQTKRWRSNLRSYLEINRARWQHAGNVVIAANRLLVGAQRESNLRPGGGRS